MSRYAKTDVEMWVDGKFRQLSPLPPCGQGLWIYLLIGPMTTALPGLLRVGRAALAEELGWTLGELDVAFGEIEAQRMAEADWGARVVWLPRALERNLPANPSVVAGWAPHLQMLPDCALKVKALARMREVLVARSIGSIVEAFDRVVGQQAGRSLGAPVVGEGKAGRGPGAPSVVAEGKAVRGCGAPVQTEATTVRGCGAPVQTEATTVRGSGAPCAVGDSGAHGVPHGVAHQEQEQKQEQQQGKDLPKAAPLGVAEPTLRGAGSALRAAAEAVYALYPRKVGRGRALPEIEKALRRLVAGQDAPALELGEAKAFLAKLTAEFARSPAGQAGTFTPHPATWFSASRYLDDVAEWQRERDGERAGVPVKVAARGWQPTREQREHERAMREARERMEREHAEAI